MGLNKHIDLDNVQVDGAAGWATFGNKILLDGKAGVIDNGKIHLWSDGRITNDKVYLGNDGLIANGKAFVNCL